MAVLRNVHRTYKPKSTTKKAKAIIRNEMLSYFPAQDYGTKTRLQAMKKDADAGNGGRRVYVSNYDKGAYLVQSGCCAIYYGDQAKMLSKIYGKKNVDKWSSNKIHNTYKHLIGREYDSMQKEKRKTTIRKATRKPTKRKTTRKHY